MRRRRRENAYPVLGAWRGNMMDRRQLGALLLALVASGCVTLGGGSDVQRVHEATTGAVEEVATAAVGDATAITPPADPPTQRRDVRVDLSVQEPWVRPRQGFDAVANASLDAELSWYVWARGGDAFVEPISGYLYVGGAPSPLDDDAHHHGTPPHAPLATGDLPSGESTRAFAFWKEGRYEIAARDAPHARVNVTVSSSTDAREVAHVTLVHDAFGLRFSPADLNIHPSTRVRFWNAAPTTHAFEEVRFLVSVPAEADARALRFMAVDPGSYELLVVARKDADAWGEAARPFVIDFESPAMNVTLGPWEGRVSAVASPVTGETSRTHTFTAAYPLRALRLELRLDAATEEALPPEATWRLARDGEEVASASAQDAQLLLAALPPGEYALTIEGSAGLVNYRAWGEARHRLEAPETAP